MSLGAVHSAVSGQVRQWLQGLSCYFTLFIIPVPLLVNPSQNLAKKRMEKRMQEAMEEQTKQEQAQVDQVKACAVACAYRNTRDTNDFNRI